MGDSMLRDRQCIEIPNFRSDVYDFHIWKSAKKLSSALGDRQCIEIGNVFRYVMYSYGMPVLGQRRR